MWGEMEPASVRRLDDGTWHYTLPANIVGSVRVRATAYAGPGSLRLQHCERLEANASVPTCVRLRSRMPAHEMSQ